MNIIDSMKFREYFRKDKKSIGIAGAFLLVAYGIKVFQIMFSHDTEAIISVPESLYESWLTMGRYGLVFIKKLLGIYTFNPYLASILMFLTMLGIVVVWGYLFYVLNEERYDSRVSWIFSVAFLTTPMMAEQISFLLQAFEVCLAILLLGIVLLMVWQAILTEHHLWFLPSVILTVIVFSVYQTMVPLFITGAAACFLIHYQNREKSWWPVLLKMVMVFCVGFLAYEIINKIIMTALGISTTSYISEQMVWGTVPFSEVAENIVNHIWRSLSGQGFYYSAAFGIATVLALVYLVVRIKRKEKEYYLLVIATVVFVMTPFLMTFLMGQEPKMRTQLGQGFVTGFYFQYGASGFLARSKKVSRFLSFSILALSLILGFQQSTKLADMFYTEYIQYQEDVNLALKISNRIDMLDLGESPQEPVVFIGARSPKLNRSGIREMENLGHSFFEWSFTTGYGSFIMRNFMASLGYIYQAPSEEQIKTAEEVALNMGIWPASDSVQVTDGVIVVRLS